MSRFCTAIYFFSILISLNYAAFALEQFEIKNGSDGNMKVEQFGDGSTAIILAYQYNGKIEDWQEFAKLLEVRGHTSFLFDFNGYGETKDRKNRTKNHLDIEALANFVKERGYNKLYLIGSSMGAGAVLKAGENLETNGIIALAPYVDRQSKFSTPSKKTAKLITEEVLLVSARGDDSARHAIKLNKLIPNSELLMYEGKAHGMGILKTSDSDDLKSKIFKFIEK